MPIAYWKLGKIEKLDARQAIAYVRSQGKLLMRSIKLLYPLEVAVERPPQSFQYNNNIQSQPVYICQKRLDRGFEYSLLVRSKFFFVTYTSQSNLHSTIGSIHQTERRLDNLLHHRSR